jgi:hypothetical protein
MSSIDWDECLWPANCGKCSAQFDCLLTNSLSLCGACTKQYADCAFCEVRYARLADGIQAVCDDCKKQQFADCDSCGGYFDRLQDNHPARCAVCQDLFSSEDTVVAPAALTIPQAPAPTPSEQKKAAKRPNKPDGDHYVSCNLCARNFPPNKNNDGIHCTPCCNKEAVKGNDLFTKLNLPVPPKAAENLKNARARQQQTAPASSGLSVAAASRAIITYNVGQGFGGGQGLGGM